MSKKQFTTVSMFGTLYTLQKERGLSPAIEIPLCQEGRKAGDIAVDLNLPVEMIGGIYCNHLFSDLNHVIRPGDRLAFVPKSVPGPHQSFLGLPKSEQSPAAPEIPGYLNEALATAVGARRSLI